MIMKKMMRFLAMALMAGAMFTACGGDDGPEGPRMDRVDRRM